MRPPGVSVGKGGVKRPACHMRRLEGNNTPTPFGFYLSDDSCSWGARLVVLEKGSRILSGEAVMGPN